MSKRLIIAEKPSVCADIAKALGGFTKKSDGFFEREDAIVYHARGHLFALTVPEETREYRLSHLPYIPERFGLKATDSSVASIIKTIKALAARSDVSGLINACDAEREGELIFRNLVQALNIKKPCERMWLQSLQPEAIKTAYREAKPAAEYDALYAAARARSEADWIVGINASRALTTFLREKTAQNVYITAGRVQTPVLALIVHREWAIQRFVPVNYWQVQGTFSVNGHAYTGLWTPKDKCVPTKETDVEALHEADDENGQGSSAFATRAEADAVAARVQQTGKVAKARDFSRESRKNAPALFDLTGLQMEANKKLGFSAAKTLELAQALYDKGYLTYPRTDSTALPEDSVDNVKRVIAALGSSPHPCAAFAQQVDKENWVRGDNKTIFDDSRVSDHFGLIPTDTVPHTLDGEAASIYGLVVQRFIAAFFPAAVYDKTVRVTAVGADLFKSTGTVLKQAGWKAVYGADEEEGKTATLPALPAQEGQWPDFNSVAVLEKKTTPPKRYTEATLLAAMASAGKLVDDKVLAEAMSEKGLGSAATRAALIEGLFRVNRKTPQAEPYCKREKRFIVPTSKGLNTIAQIQDTGSPVVVQLTSPVTTGEWEYRIANIRQGKDSFGRFMADIHQYSKDFVGALREQVSQNRAAQRREALADGSCPACRQKTLYWLPDTHRVECECGFSQSSLVAKRPLTREELATLLAKGQTEVLSGFVSSKNKPFSAALAIKDKAITFVFDNAKEGGGEAQALLFDADCPRCKQQLKISINQPNERIFCGNNDFRFFTTVAQRKLSPTEAKELIEKRYLSSRVGYVSKKGKTFTAALQLQEDGNVAFAFEN